MTRIFAPEVKISPSEMLPGKWLTSIILLAFLFSNESESRLSSNISGATKLKANSGNPMSLKIKLLQEDQQHINETSGLDGGFCVANSDADVNALEAGLDWVCGSGLANCTAIQPGQQCYSDNNLVAVASYAYNDYYHNGGACNFDNTAVINQTDPSFGPCIFAGSSATGTNTNTSGGGLGGVFCVARVDADLKTLKEGLDWVCGSGVANCRAIQPGQPCYIANNWAALASYAYNEYYHKTQGNGGTCDFNNTALVSRTDPSFSSCIFAGSLGAGTKAGGGGGN